MCVCVCVCVCVCEMNSAAVSICIQGFWLASVWLFGGSSGSALHSSRVEFWMRLFLLPCTPVHTVMHFHCGCSCGYVLYHGFNFVPPFKKLYLFMGYNDVLIDVYIAE